MLGEFRRLTPFVLPYRARIVFVFGVGMIATSASLVQPFLSKMLVDRGLLGRDFGVLVLAAALMVAAAVVGFVLNIVSSLQYVSLSARMLFDIRRAMFAHLQTLSPRYYAKTRLGDIVSRLNNDVSEVQRVIADVPMALFSNVVFLVGSAGLMAWLHWKLFLASVVAVPLAMVALRHYQARLTGETRDLRESSAGIGSFLIESLTAIRLVVLSNAQQRELARFEQRNDSFYAALMRLQRTSMLMGAFPAAILTAANAGVFLYGGALILRGELSIGGLVAFLAYHSRLMSPVQNLMSLTSGLVTAKVSLGRVFELLDAQPEAVEIQGASALMTARGAIEFRGVTLVHEGHTVLDRLNFAIQPGTFATLLGPSGAGKSSVADLILRLYDPDAGDVLLDGINVREVRLADLRQRVALVDQSPVLFHASVRENLRFAKPEAAESEIAHTAAELGIEHLLERPCAGERGLALSAGERQRIAIAQALLRDASVYVFDEPSAALDSDSERRLAETLRRRLEGRTVLIITHRPALAAIADQVLTLGGVEVAV